MNFINVFHISLLILLRLCGNIEAQESACVINPTNQDKIDIVVYINGDTRVDHIWYSRYCSWRDDGFPYDKYAPVTVKVGGQITCDANNQCNCPNEDSTQVDCNMTFQNVCAQQILGQKKFLNLLCCSEKVKSDNSGEAKGFQQCVQERPGLEKKIAACMKNDGSGCPREIALRTAQEVIDRGVDLSNNTEPYFFYNKIFDKCISDNSPGRFLQKICPMLKYDIARSISQCVRAMGWN